MENAATVFKYRLIPDFNALISHNSIWLDLLYLLACLSWRTPCGDQQFNHWHSK